MSFFKNMHPFQVILIAVFVVLAIGGLWAFSTFSGFGGAGDQVGTVVIWGTLPADTVNTAINDLKNSDKNYANVSYVRVDPATFDNDLADAIAAGQGPDLIIYDQEQLYTEAPRLTNIPYATLPKNTYLSTYLPIDSIYLNDTGTFGIPIVVDPLVLYYNQSILGSATGQGSPPTSWEAVAGLAPSLTQQTGGQTILKSAIALGSYDNITNARAILSLLFLQAGSSITQVTDQGVESVLGSTNSTDTQTGNTGAEAAVNFYTQFADPSKIVYSWNSSLPESKNAFTSGDLALYVGFASEEAGLAATNPNLAFAMAKIPQPGNASTRTDYGLAYAFGIPKATQNEKGAYSTALALTGSDILPAFAEALGMAPAQNALLTPDPANEFEAIYYPEALTAKGWVSPAPAAVDQIFLDMINNVTTGRFNTKDALSATDQSLDAAY